MNYKDQSYVGRVYALVGLALMSLSSVSLAETYPFRVGFENIPGVEKIEATSIAAGIDALEEYLRDSDESENGNAWATLCGAYILKKAYPQAELACNRAVRIAPTETAFNNRGVYRAMTGDFDGARNDFRRARPDELESYLQALRQKDIGLIAHDNFDLLIELDAKHSEDEVKASAQIRTAAVESLDH